MLSELILLAATAVASDAKAEFPKPSANVSVILERVLAERRCKVGGETKMLVFIRQDMVPASQRPDFFDVIVVFRVFRFGLAKDGSRLPAPEAIVWQDWSYYATFSPNRGGVTAGDMQFDPLAKRGTSRSSTVLSRTSAFKSTSSTRRSKPRASFPIWCPLLAHRRELASGGSTARSQLP